MDETLKLSEIFHTISGEGLDIGIPTTYIRVFGCNMKPVCSFCDTMYSVNVMDDTIETLNFNEIIDKIEKIGCRRIAFTGGEPFLYIDKIKVIMERLMERKNYDFHFETNGLIFDPINTKYYIREMVIALSPKMHALNDDYYATLKKWVYSSPYTVFLKFVYENEGTVDSIRKLENTLGGFGDRPVYVMPEGRGINKKLYQECYKVCLDNDWRMSPRLQCIVWDDERGT
jgi:organic radical activating enzyme